MLEPLPDAQIRRRSLGDMVSSGKAHFRGVSKSSERPQPRKLTEEALWFQSSIQSEESPSSSRMVSMLDGQTSRMEICAVAGSIARQRAISWKEILRRIY